MFTVYIDDSGTAPEHKMAVAAGILFPAVQIPKFDVAWKALLTQEQIPDFHASECLARNPHSAFASWDDARVRRIFAAIRRLTFRHSVKGWCISVQKSDYEAVVTPDMKTAVGKSYFTWAVSSVFGLAHDWSLKRKMPLEYVFDITEKKVQREIEDALAFVEVQFPGDFVGHYSFRKRAGVPGLQAVDLFAWTCYQQFLQARFKHPINLIAIESGKSYESAKNGEWRTVQSLNREGIEKWVRENRSNPRTQEIIAFKQQLKEARKPKKKGN